MLVYGSMFHPLYLKCNADLHRIFAAGKIPVVIALAHADPEAVCIESRAGHKDQIQRFRQQNLRPAQDGGADAVLSHLPAVRAGHSGCKGIRLAAHRIGQRFALRLRLFRKGRKVGFGTKRRVQQDGLRILHGIQLPEECAQSGICSLAFFRAESLACGTARFALGLLCFTDRHQRTPRFI